MGQWILGLMTSTQTVTLPAPSLTLTLSTLHPTAAPAQQTRDELHHEEDLFLTIIVDDSHGSVVVRHGNVGDRIRRALCWL